MRKTVRTAFLHKINSVAAQKSPTLFLYVALLVAIPAATHAQDVPHTIPATVFVGDRAVLLVPLPGFSGHGDVEMPAGSIPESPDIDIHRVALERRPGGSRLAVEFAAFATGVLELPPLEIGGEVFRGLSVEIASVLAPGEPPILSLPPVPLAVPGTSLLVYGTVAVVVLILFLASLTSLRGRGWLAARLAQWRRRRVLRLMLATERRMRKALAKGADPREVLDGLSREFRAFLSNLTGENCMAMTAREIGFLFGTGDRGQGTGEGTDEVPLDDFQPANPPAKIPNPPSQTSSPLSPVPCPLSRIENFLSRCDGARFSGLATNSGGTLELLDELRGFIPELARSRPEGKAAGESGEAVA